MHIEAVREHDRRTLLQERRQILAIDIALQLIGYQDHRDVGPSRDVLDLHHGQACFLYRLRGRRVLAQTHRDLLHAGIPQVQRMRVTLAAVADNGHALCLDDPYVGVSVVIYSHIGS